MHTRLLTTPDAATGNEKLAAEITDKRGYGERWRFSVRHVDNLLARGLPHLKIGERRVRILVPEADAWMREKYGTRRLGPATPSVVVLAAASAATDGNGGER